jgi:ABC-type antimicrobial peptide transport system permease subunit
MVFVSLFTLILSFVFSFVIREIFNYLSFPTFLSLFHVGIYLLVIMGAFLLCFFASVLPLRRIKDKDIQKELEGED